MSKPGVIPYRMSFEAKVGDPYVLLATLNVGWCKQDDEWIRAGDYHTVTSPRFEGTEEGVSTVVNAILEGFKTGKG